MDRKKVLINEYKQRKVVGGVFKVFNAKTGKYLLDFTPDIQSKQNAFNFSSSHNSCIDYLLKKDWQLYGSSAFSFEVLDKLEKKDTQTQEEFTADLKALCQLWSEKLDPSLRY